MKDNITKEMWDIFDETGIFLALCCHGFSLIVDMVQSGELAKYPLAVVKKLWDVFGNGLAGWFDINCKFKKHALEEFPWCTCKGTQPHLPSRYFHGHTHRHLCQLDHLATYTKGLGLKDLKGCKQAFSKSNTLTLSICYASVFY
ncbi:hypothetical protein SERLA73DRAFT_43591 [Serpula lacrymans var. lacrymans S7.3]|uniref:Uncharacterized protein n=1 Tax=Serpula lacrymans var. lacrymans (strain S7.3) TaxID=936435 RepID=F8PHF8_SERL3|nr:hypothetical protein SERLA73DRAFT_43591 [Serpula lacrymans var. lacrymans S7.3]